jgi:hypothetical protein
MTKPSKTMFALINTSMNNCMLLTIQLVWFAIVVIQNKCLTNKNIMCCVLLLFLFLYVFLNAFIVND